MPRITNPNIDLLENKRNIRRPDRRRISSVQIREMENKAKET